MPGKSNTLLKLVDRTAKQAADAGTALDTGHITGKIGRARGKGGSATIFPAAGQELTIRVYGSRLVSRTEENLIKFEIYDATTEQCGAKHFAYAQPAVGAELHRQRVFRVQMNDNPQYPQIVRVMEKIPVSARKKPDSAKVDASAAAAESQA